MNTPIPPHIGPYIPNLCSRNDVIGAALRSPHLLVGVDRLTVSFPCLPPRGASNWHTRTFQRAKMTVGQQQLVIARGSQAVTARATFVNSPNTCGLFVTFNPSRLMDPDGSGLAPVDAIPAMITSHIVPLLPLIAPIPSVDQWNIYRVDLAVDIETPGVTQQVLRSAFDHIYRPRHHTYAYLNGPSHLGTVGRKSVTRPRLSIYDKAALERSGPPRVRFETQCRREALRSLGYRELGSLDSQGARAIFQDELSEVISSLSATAPPLRFLDLGRADQKTALELIGLSVLHNQGITPEVSASATRRHRRFLRSQGVRVMADLSFGP